MDVCCQNCHPSRCISFGGGARLRVSKIQAEVGSIAYIYLVTSVLLSLGTMRLAGGGNGEEGNRGESVVSNAHLCFSWGFGFQRAVGLWLPRLRNFDASCPSMWLAASMRAVSMSAKNFKVMTSERERQQSQTM